MLTVHEDHPMYGTVAALLRTRNPDTIDGPEAAERALRPLLFPADGLGLECERLAVLACDRRNRVIDAAVLTQGSNGFTIVDPAQLYRWALTREAPVRAIVLGHNHPSGDPTLSRQDREVTERVARVGGFLGVPLLDHLVLVADGFTSAASLGLVPSVEAYTFMTRG
jgi:DNA repair protein RadC